MSHREIKFRGKCHATGEWVYGVPVFDEKQPQIAFILDLQSEVVVERESVGQFTGMKDVKGVDLYEGDIVEAILNHHGKPIGVPFHAKIVYNNHIAAFQISYRNINNQFVNGSIEWGYFKEIKGNTSENIELLSP